VRVAKNQVLPRLDLTGSAAYQGLAGQPQDAFNSLNSGDYLSYTVGVSLEYPLGNRERRALLRQRRFERLKAVAALQNVADQVAVQVKERVRQVYTSFEEIKAQHAATEAARLQLEALEETERIRGRLTPEFLQVKLSAQETLAAAERAELDALVQFNGAMADLARATGTVLDLHGVQVALPKILETPDLKAAALERAVPRQPTAVPRKKPLDKPQIVPPPDQMAPPPARVPKPPEK